MVRTVQKDNKKLYQCEAYSFHYEDKEKAEQCEAWCRAQHSCNLEIIQYAEENRNN